MKYAWTKTKQPVIRRSVRDSFFKHEGAVLVLILMPQAADNLMSNGLHHLSCHGFQHSCLFIIFIFRGISLCCKVEKRQHNSMPVHKGSHCVFVQSGWMVDVDAGGRSFKLIVVTSQCVDVGILSCKAWGT